jgi:dipeptidyl aminopeptidase/acylaminoacyl peptidase
VTFTGFDDRVRAWLLERDPGEVPEALRASASRVPFEVRRPLVARLIERGLPMTEVETRFERIGVSRQILVTCVVIVLLLVGLAIGLLLVGGTQPRLPAPYGPAANGQIAFASEGDIFTVDPETGVTTAIVTGAENDTDPAWSLDGTRIVFRRTLPDEAGDRLYLARADGGGLVSLTPEPIANIISYSFSPDGQSVMLDRGFGDTKIANADGTGVRSLDAPLAFCGQDDGCDTSFRPPDGDQIVFVNGTSTAVNTVNIDGTGQQILVPQKSKTGVTSPRWSPDGARVAYGTWTYADTATIRAHIVNADGTMDRALPMPPGAVWEGPPVWSNDGTRLAIMRGYGPFFERTVVAVVPADEGGLGVETDPSLLAGWEDVNLEWAPDDSAILLTRTASDAAVPAQQVQIDPQTGEFHETPWRTVSRPAWQRIAP